MKRALARITTLAAALPLAAGMIAGGSTAHATPDPSVTIPGCWGAAGTVLCDIVLTVETPDPYFSVIYVEVCAGDCYNVPVQWVNGTADADLCYSYEDRQGNPTSGCVGDWTGTTVNIKPIVLDIIGCSATVCAYE